MKIKGLGVYRKRSVRFMGLLRADDWRLKEYGISYRGERPAPLLVQAARDVAKQRLGLSGGLSNHYGVGFVGVHEGKTGNFVFVDWWADQNELHHHVYVSPLDSPADLEYETPSGLSACIWDLFVIGHERDAWVECVLKSPRDPDLETYLETVLNAEV